MKYFAATVVLLAAVALGAANISHRPPIPTSPAAITHPFLSYRPHYPFPTSSPSPSPAVSHPFLSFRPDYHWDISSTPFIPYFTGLRTHKPKPTTPKSTTEEDPSGAIPRSYPRYAVEPWGQNPLYYQQINEGRYDQNLTYDVSFGSLNSDFGILGQKDDKLLQHNPKVLKFDVVREGCPVSFVRFFLRKVNHLRSRHQADYIEYDEGLTRLAQGPLNDYVLNGASGKKNSKYPANLARSEFKYAYTTGGVTNIRQDAENLVQRFYSDSIADYHIYGQNPSAQQAAKYRNFASLVWRSNSKVGVACVTKQTDNKLKSSFAKGIFSDVYVTVLYGHEQKQNLFAANVLPPGYFDFDDKLIGEEKQTKQEQKINRGFNDIFKS